ncbi:hypothetical protein A2866_05810 [Candidatus Roizmanbacteria bacterium RIFCSPHIGHO2_01_FULL_39_8]|uniref:Uncharacterized protein n=2 Tax=Candidatus Roizmaniibacteriota TaxID=1752723 RepID=A0A1F7GT88_9BACT|nr:MAG: hypothetical protein A2866_05810 [Candidatus Roizmanbacteria bacterium RIFCSPHIGHO2_01_FULL_39_8]OGK27234.1 MAG: hypothetical protein A3C28_04335 [Candidatus Roizmanbacteria bacterium RIFCSPHIGHO2_02_FULL_39_9]
MNKLFTSLQRGQSLIEILIAMSLITILIPALVVGLTTSREGKAQQIQRLKAVNLMREAQEAVRSVREKGWTTFAVNGIYHPQINSVDHSWQLIEPGEITSDGFSRTVTISDVRRTNNGVIDQTGGTYIDPSTKQVIISVTWEKPLHTSFVTTSYITRHENIAYTWTTQADFDSSGSEKINTFSTDTSGGEIILGAGGGGGNWCQPSKSITEVDLPKSGIANAISAIEGSVFAGTGDNASGVSFAKISLETDQNPPAASTTATFDGFKTNAVFGENDYVYLGTDNNSQEVVIIDLTQYSDPPTNKKYKQIGSINLPGNINANGIYVVNNIAYVLGSDSKLYLYNITNRSHDYGTSEYSGQLGLSGKGKKILVNGSYAYIATDSTTNQFQIVNVSNINSPTLTGQLTLGSSQRGVDLYVDIQTGDLTRAYFVTDLSGSNSDFFIINVSNKTTPQIVTGFKGFNTNGMNPKGVTIVPGNKAIIVGSGGTDQYQVVDITDETATLTTCAKLQYSTGINGVASVLQSNGYAYSYIITGDASTELKIILGGAGGQYSSAGTYESSILNTNYTTAFNSFSATVAQPPNTSIKFQVAARAVDGVCPTTTDYTYVGPNGDQEQYFVSSTDPSMIQGVIPIITTGTYTNPSMCFRFKAWLSTTASTSTPLLYDFTVNYSP